MEAGYYIPTSINHKLVLIWILIILGFNRTLFYELNQEANWFFTVFPIMLCVLFLFLVCPRRFFIVGDKIYFTIFPFLKFKIVNVKFIKESKATKFGHKFYYSKKHYEFICLNRSLSAIL